MVTEQATRTKGVGDVTEAEDGEQPQLVLSLSTKLKWLFENIRRPNGKPHTPQEVAEYIVERGGRSTREHITNLRSGKADNPSIRVVEGIAAFFDVTPAYFVDDDRAREIQAQLNLAVQLRDDGVRAVALRAVTSALADGDLSVDALREIHGLIVRRSGRVVDETRSPDSGEHHSS